MEAFYVFSGYKSARGVKPFKGNDILKRFIIKKAIIVKWTRRWLPLGGLKNNNLHGKDGAYHGRGTKGAVGGNL